MTPELESDEGKDRIALRVWFSLIEPGLIFVVEWTRCCFPLTLDLLRRRADAAMARMKTTWSCVASKSKGTKIKTSRPTTAEEMPEKRKAVTKLTATKAAVLMTEIHVQRFWM